MFNVVRHCPVPKGLRQEKSRQIATVDGRKTLPCSKGIETKPTLFLTKSEIVVRHCPVPKGLRQFHSNQH